MIFDNFELHAQPFITRAYCKCGDGLREVSNGPLSRAMYCPTCENVYQLKLVKVSSKRVSPEFLDQCRASIPQKVKS